MNKHPWVVMAESMSPQPMPSIVKWDNIKVTLPDGKVEDGAVLSVATPSGCMTLFLSVEDFDRMLDQAAEVRANMNEGGLYIAQQMPGKNGLVL